MDQDKGTELREIRVEDKKEVSEESKEEDDTCLDKVKNAMVDVGTETKKLAIQAKDAVMNSDIIQKVKESFRNLSQDTKQVIREAKEVLEEWAKIQIERSIRKLLQRCPPLIKERVTDKNMCDCVKDIIGDIVDDIWPEIEEEIIYELRYKIDYLEKYELKEVKHSDSCLCKCWWNIVVWYRYATQPVDKSVWQRMKWISFWFLLLIRMFPFYGISPIVLIFDLLMIDKSDEYQLTQFIINFKKFHFITFGIVRGLMGFMLYYLCMLRSSPMVSSAQCVDVGPGGNIGFIIEGVSFCIMCLTTWVASICLICSVKRGTPRFRFLKSEEEEKGKIVEKKSCFCMCCCPATVCKYIIE